MTDGPSAPAHLWDEHLTPRHAQVLELVAEGLRNGEIARELFISESTLDNHLNAIYGRLDAPTRVHAARWWWENVELAELLAHRGLA